MGKETPDVATRKRDVRPDRQTGGPEGPAPRRRRYRAIAGIFFGSLIAYLIGVGLYSVIPQIFSPARGELPESVTCRDGLTSLRGELLDYSGERIRHPGGDDALASFFSDWDSRHLALESRCADGPEQDAWELLGRMRQRVEGTLARYDREEGELARAMDSTLAAP